MVFEIEITRFVPQPTSERFTSEMCENAARHVQMNDVDEFVIFVAALDCGRKLDLGNFYVFCNAERASILLHEHCEHGASDPQLRTEQRPAVSFRGEDGSEFSVPYERTVSRNQALAALSYWLPAQQRTPELRWT